MSNLDFHWPDVDQPRPQLPTVSLQEVVDRYDLVHVSGEYMVVVDKQESKQFAEPKTTELGSTGQTKYGSFFHEEYNPALQGQQGIKTYDQMRRSDAQIRRSLRVVKTPVLAAHWYMEPFSEGSRDRMIAQYVWDNLTKWMTQSWPQLLVESLLCLDFGWYAFEPVFEIVGGKARWRKFAPRHPADSQGWEYDSHGGPIGCWFPGATDDNGIANKKLISIDDLLVFTHEKEGGNMEGISALRSAYKHWYFKDNLYKIDGIQKERHGIGIPLIKLPVGFTVADRTAADDLGRNLRTNERAHVVLPPNWEIMMLKMEGQPVDCLPSIEHHDKMIMANVLADTIGTDDDSQMFLKGTRFIADIVRDVFNKWAIPRLVDYNWRVKGYPELRARRIGDTIDWRTMSFAIRNLIGAKVLRPDDRLEEWLRDEMDLPKVDLATIRPVDAPQLPNSGLPRVALPRQSQAGNMQQAQTPGSNGRVGQDVSGG